MSDSEGPYGEQNNPDPYGDTPQSNPYGSTPPPPSPYSPYGAPGSGSPDPYGAPPNPYGGPQFNPSSVPGYGAPTGPVKTDGMSIGALVAGILSLPLSVCCGIVGIVAVVLGILGMRRTRDGRAKGRGMAVAGIVLGGIGIVITVVLGVLVVVLGVHQVVTPSNAKVGQCVNIDQDGSKISMLKKSCTDSHDGEIVAAGKVTSENIDQAAKVAFCTSLMSAEDQIKLLQDSSLKLSSVTENPDHIKVGDHVVCYVESSSGSKLSDDVLK